MIQSNANPYNPHPLFGQIKRNGVTIPPCRVLMMFPVWTQDTLVLAQAKKAEVNNLRKKFLDQKDESIEKMKASKNPIQRVDDAINLVFTQGVNPMISFGSALGILQLSQAPL